MREPVVSIVEGWTAALPFTAEADGVGFDLTGLTVAIVLKNSELTIVKESSSGITVTDSTAGEWQYEAATSSGDLFLSAQSPYRLRLKVTDAFGKLAYFPNDEESLIEVNPK
jgi:hypothetical protein